MHHIFREIYSRREVVLRVGCACALMLSQAGFVVWCVAAKQMRRWLLYGRQFVGSGLRSLMRTSACNCLAELATERFRSRRSDATLE